METPTSKRRAAGWSPPEESKDKPRQQQMSASLRERLKRSRRTFAALSAAKRLCVDGDEEEEEDGRRRVPTQTKESTRAAAPCCKSPRRDGQDVDLNRNNVGERSKEAGRVPAAASAAAAAAAAALIVPITTQPSPPPLPPLSADELLRLRDQLKLDIKHKTETLRRLKMVQMYREKNDLTQLQSLICKWRSCSQTALYDLQTSLPSDGRKASLSQIIDRFGLDDTMLHFDRTEDDFTT